MRLETMVLMGMDMPLRAVQGLIASSIDILIHLGRLPSGRRKILEISELLGFDGTDYRMNPLFRYQLKKGEQGNLQLVNEIVDNERLLSYGEFDNYKNALERFDGNEQKV